VLADASVEANSRAGHRRCRLPPRDAAPIKLREQTREALRRATAYVAGLSRKRKVVPLAKRGAR